MHWVKVGDSLPPKEDDKFSIDVLIWVPGYKRWITGYYNYHTGVWIERESAYEETPSHWMEIEEPKDDTENKAEENKVYQNGFDAGYKAALGMA